MLFKLISDGKHTMMELDGKTLGASVQKVTFSHDSQGGADGKGDVKLDLTFDLRDVFESEKRGNRFGVVDEDGRFGRTVENYEQNQKELYSEYSSARKQREEIRKALRDDKSQFQ